jgi:hypothetical protein
MNGEYFFETGGRQEDEDDHRQRNSAASVATKAFHSLHFVNSSL